MWRERIVTAVLTRNNAALDGRRLRYLSVGVAIAATCAGVACTVLWGARAGLAAVAVAAVIGILAARLLAAFELQQRRISELSKLHEISTIVQSAGDLDRLLSSFARALNSLAPFTEFYIARLDPEGALLPITRIDPDGRAHLDTSTEEQPTRHPWFTLRGTTIWSSDHGPVPRFYTAGEWPAVVLPLQAKRQSLGLVVVTPARPPTTEQAALMTQAVGQLAIALDSLMLYRQATVRAARIQVLGNLARIVGSVLDLRDAFDTFAEEVRWLIPFERAMILRIDPERGIAQPYLAYPRNDDLLAARETLSTSLARFAYQSPTVVTLARDDVRAEGCDWSLFGDPTHLAMVPIVGGEVHTALFAVARADGQRYTADEVGALDEIARLLAVSIERVELFQRAEHNARHDLLTGLANYRGLQERIAEVQLGIVEPGSTTVLMVDMDDLKVVNDTLGHSVGDEVVRAVARAMREACRADDFVARVGGDEFVVVMEGVDAEAGVLVADRIHEALRDVPLTSDGLTRAIRVSVGVAAAPRDADSMADLLQAADSAMYDAKFAGGGRTALANTATGSRHTQALLGRPDRLVETLVRAAMAGATIEERDAFALAERYALAVAERLALPADDAEVLKLLVARHAGSRLVQPRSTADHSIALTALDGLAKAWSSNKAESTALTPGLVAAATELAWLQLPSGSACAIDEALRRLILADDSAPAVVLRELATVAREGIETSEVRRSTAA